ncbi:BACON domain-containing protein [Streptomyces sp. NPDC002004]
MMSSRTEISTQTTGARRTQREGRRRAVPRVTSQTPPVRYEPYLDGLFTYCLSVLCDHDAATVVLGDALALAERRRWPEAEGDRRAWLYALARWSCLRKLAEARHTRQGARHGAHASGRRAVAETSQSAPSEPPVPDELQQHRRRELALLAWPEAAGTTPEQREALELAVRHRLGAHEVAAVLSLDLPAARELLASAACEVERTRAALAVVETGSCPIVARLTGDNQVLLGTALRRELVRHVDDCPRCRRTAERAVPGVWPGTSASPAALPVLEAPRPALCAAMAHAPRARGGAPRFDQRGFPMDPRDRAARRDRLRARAVTTTVVATVVAAPVLALWAAYRGAPLTGEGRDGRPITATEANGGRVLDGERTRDAYENAGNARTTRDPRFTGSSSPDVSVEVISAGAVPSRSGTGPGRLTVEAQPSGGATLITLTASGGSPVRWHAHTGAAWLRLSRSSGTLAPGESLTLQVRVDHRLEPAGPWSARIALDPSGAVIAVDGHGRSRPPGRPDPTPTPTHPTSPDPTPTPTDPSPSDPTPTPTDSGPSDPPPSPTPTETASSPSGSSPDTSPPGDGGGGPGQG